MKHPVRALAVAMFITVIGPPIGGLIVVLSELKFLMMEGGLRRGLAMLAYSYEFGGMQAAITGLWLGYRTYTRGRFTYIEAVLTALAASVLFSAWVAAGFRWPYPAPFFPLVPALLLGAVSVCAAIVCRSILRGLGVLATADRRSAPP